MFHAHDGRTMHEAHSICMSSLAAQIKTQTICQGIPQTGSFSCAAVLSLEEESVVSTLFTHGKGISRACKKGIVYTTLRYRMIKHNDYTTRYTVPWENKYGFICRILTCCVDVSINKILEPLAITVVVPIWCQMNFISYSSSSPSTLAIQVHDYCYHASNFISTAAVSLNIRDVATPSNGLLRLLELVSSILAM